MIEFVITSVLSLVFIFVSSFAIMESIYAFKGEHYFKFGFWVMLTLYSTVSLVELLIYT